MTSIENILKEILIYLDVTRQKGYTTSMFRGVNNTDKVIVIVHDMASIKHFKDICNNKNCDFISLGQIGYGCLRGRDAVIVFDNAALMVLLSRVLNEYKGDAVKIEKLTNKLNQINNIIHE